EVDDKTGNFIAKMLFVTITNVNFSTEDMVKKIEESVAFRDELKKGLDTAGMDDSVNWDAGSLEELHRKAETVGVLSTGEDDVRSLRNLLIIGLKGIAAYYEHANVLGYYQKSINEFLAEALASTTKELPVPEMIDMVMKAGQVAVDTMALLDKANTTTYGNPEITKVNIGVRNNPGILISGHDLKDMDELLKQTEGTGVDVYTHGEMLPANYYPAFKKYEHFVGNYGNSWWLQDKEFETFNGPVLMTTNCLTPPKDSYKDRVFTTSVVSFPGLKHIPDRPEGGQKDFSQIIAMAKTCKPPVEIETGSIIGGFAHAQVTALADKVVDAVKSGAIKRFIVMAGCDGRHKERDYFTQVAQDLPDDSVILTAGCAKYRYNKLDLGDIGGIPRVLDAGQCNDSYSLAVIALKLKEIFGAESINDLPISFDIAWYEQKAVAVLLALLALGVKGIRLGPTLPAFLSPNVIKVLVDKFDIKPIGDVKADVEAMMAGK
ncbi:MAG: hydroxylamine reductase, partial [Deltaproteobacteria bacterium]|nr:hydroxylamine reductase [Deltaproteobacteria bacterium]